MAPRLLPSIFRAAGVGNRPEASSYEHLTRESNCQTVPLGGPTARKPHQTLRRWNNPERAELCAPGHRKWAAVLITAVAG